MRPSATMHSSCVEEFTLFLEPSAFTIGFAKGCPIGDELVNASIMSRVVLIGKAHITAEHHLVFTSNSGVAVNTLPLVVSSINFLWSPTFKNERSVIVIIEDTLVGSVTPGSNKARVLGFCSTKCVSTRNGSGKSPLSITSSSTSGITVNMVDKDGLQVSATSLCSWK